MEYTIFEYRKLTVHRIEVVRALGDGPILEDVVEVLCSPPTLVEVDDGVVKVSF